MNGIGGNGTGSGSGVGSGVGIVGIGISGLQLALFLQWHGVDTCVYSAVPVEALAGGRVSNMVTRWAPTLDRERSLDLLDPEATATTCMRVAIPAAGVDIRGHLDSAGDNTDFRMYLPHLLGIYLARGGSFAVGECGPPQLATLAARHELVVVATGRDGYGSIFPVDPARSPHTSPPREWTVGFYTGIDPPESDVEILVVPGAGEIFNIRFRSFSGPALAVGFAGLPGGPLSGVFRHRQADDPAAFVTEVLAALRTHAPEVHARVDEKAFGPTRPLDVLQGAFTPVVRRAWAPLDDGRVVMAAGDAWVLNDPVVAQGANLGSRTAFTLGAAIVAGGPYDEQFARRTEAEMWAQAEAPTTLTNAFLEPPAPHVVELLARASADTRLADEVVSGLADPEGMLALLAPEPAAV